MKLLTDQMGIRHHMTLTYYPWANGVIDIFGRQLLYTMLSELGYIASDWTPMYPLVSVITESVTS